MQRVGSFLGLLMPLEYGLHHPPREVACARLCRVRVYPPDASVALTRALRWALPPSVSATGRVIEGFRREHMALASRPVVCYV